MTQQPDTTQPDTQAMPSSQPAVGRSAKVDPLARRRLLLSALGKGAAVVGVAVPLQTLAASALVCNGRSGKSGLCTVSGFQSAMHSFGAGSTQLQAQGGTVTYWGMSTWMDPNVPGGHPWPIPYTTLYKSIFGGSSTLTLFQTLKLNNAQSHWVAAYLNALQFYPGSFPYPAVTTGGVMGVREWYSSPQSAQALTLFTSIEIIWA